MQKVSRADKLKLIKKLVEKAAIDPVVFIDRFFYTFDPRLSTPRIRFRLFDYQKALVSQAKDAVDGNYDIFIDKSRDTGASYTILATCLWYWRYVPGSNILLGSRKESFVDNRFGTIGAKGDESMANKEESLFGKLDFMLRNLPSDLLPKGFDFKKHNGFMKILNPENGNVISGESSNANFSRGGRYKIVVLDEFAFWDNDNSAWGSTADTTNTRIVITTPGIKPSKAKRLRFGKDGENIKIIEIDYTQDPRKNNEWEALQRSRRSSDDFAREIQRNWETAIKGRVYEEIANIIVGDFPYNPDFPLYVSWDFGLDGTGIQWWQKNLGNGKKRLIHSYFNVDKPIQFFLPLFGLPIDSTFNYTGQDIDFIMIVRNFKKAIHYGDPDVSKRAYQTSQKVSTRQVLQNSGIYVQTNTESNDFHTRRNATKVLLQNAPEINNTPNNDYWIECMKNAQYPQRQEGSQATSEINLPIHNWTSHHRTSTEYFAVNYIEEILVVIPVTDDSNRNWAIGSD